MNLATLDHLFRPKSVALIGASNRAGSLGDSVMLNLLQAGFAGPILPVNPKYQSVRGVLCYPDVEALPLAPDLAILTTPSAACAEIIEQLGRRGVRAAVVMSLGPGARAEAAKFAAGLTRVARAAGVRLLGPGSNGIQVPSLGLNASWFETLPKPGGVAFVSQSGSYAASVVEWAAARKVGMSHVVSAGDAEDVDIADILDYLSTRDPSVRAVLMYIRSIPDSRKFMSATRALARIKPVIVIRPETRWREADRGESGEGADLVGNDEVFDAAVRRAGILSVRDADDLFDALTTLSRRPRPGGERLALVGNGSGPVETAAGTLTLGGGSLAVPSQGTRDRLGGEITVAPGPALLDLGRGASADRYGNVVRALVQDSQVDAILVLHTPTAVAPSGAVAEEIARIAEESPHRSILACWLGQHGIEGIRERFAEAGVPTYATPNRAARAFLHLVHYRRNQAMLLETPSTPPPQMAAGRRRVRRIVDRALAAGRQLLDEQATTELLAAYGLPVVASRVVATPEQAGDAAAAMGFPVSLRLSATTVVRGGKMAELALDLADRQAVEAAATRLAERRPSGGNATPVPGFVVQQASRRSGVFALMAGIASDREFGPTMVFGLGGAAAHRSVQAAALPPLNTALAAELISRAGVLHLLSAGGREHIDEAALRSFLVQLSQFAVDVPEIAALEINPLICGRDGVRVLEARMELDPAARSRRLAIRPYPRELEETLHLNGDAKVLLRPVRPEDEPAFREFLDRVPPKDLRTRFFSTSIRFNTEQTARMVQIDYDREMALVTLDGEGRILGEVRLTTTPDNSEAEYAILLASDMQGAGLGRALMEKIIAYATSRGTRQIRGLVLHSNHRMLGLCARLGFRSRVSEDPEVMDVRLTLPGETAPRERESEQGG